MRRRIRDSRIFPTIPSRRAWVLREVSEPSPIFDSPFEKAPLVSFELGGLSFAGVEQLSPACVLVPEIVAIGVSDWLNRISNAVGFDLWWSWSRVGLSYLVP